MTAGIPGTGIGGLFYVAAALWLPFRGLIRRLRGEPVRWTRSWGPAVLAMGVLVGLWTTGELLGLLVAYAFPAVLASPTSHAPVTHASNLFHAASLALSAGSLSAVLVGVQIARLLVRRGEGRSLPPPR